MADKKIRAVRRANLELSGALRDGQADYRVSDARCDSRPFLISVGREAGGRNIDTRHANPVRVVDAFVDELDLSELGFGGVDPEATGRPSYHPSILLKLYIYG
jgi:hypothetical protein